MSKLQLLQTVISLSSTVQTHVHTLKIMLLGIAPAGLHSDELFA
jgi:hypothetical protein